jgi:beta-hydroxylase
MIYLPLMPILNVINVILLLSLNNPPFIQNITDEFELNTVLEENYKEIRNEYIKYNDKKKIDCFRYNNPLLSNIDTIDLKNDYCWRMLYLKKAGVIVKDIIPYFPKTIEFIKDDRIHNAFFSILDPYVEIKPHTGPYKGYLRYHLGIIVPEENGKKPYIICGNERYQWLEGKGVVFDDMFIHYVNNPTSQKRVVLFFDIKRKNLNWFLHMLSESGMWLTENSYIFNLYIKNQHIPDKISNNS